MEHLSADSKVWVYQASRELSDTEVTEISEILSRFAQQWVSHNQALKAVGQVLHNRFILLLVDETQAGVSGCSIDSSVHFLQKLGAEYNIDWFGRLDFAYVDGDAIKVAHKDEFADLYQSSQINEDTLVFNNLVKTKAEWDSQWQIPLKDSWHKNFV